MTATLTRLLLTLSIGLFILPNGIFSQPLQISGKITEQNSLALRGKKVSLKGVKIILNGNTIVSDQNGNFLISIPKKEAVISLHSGEANYQIINQTSLEQQLACTNSNQVFLELEFGREQTIVANSARFYQQLNQVFAQTQIRWFKLFYENKIDSLKVFLGENISTSDINRGFIREFFQDLEGHIEYWAESLSLINLDHQSTDFKNCYQWLRTGQLDQVRKTMDNLAMTGDLQNKALKDLLISWYTASGQLHKAVMILNQHLATVTKPDIATLSEYYRLNILIKAFDKAIGIEEQLLSIACDKGSKFIALVHLVELYAEQLDWGKGSKRFEQAQRLWDTEINQHSERFGDSYAELLVNMGVMLYQQSDMQQAKSLVNKAIGIYEKKSLLNPARFEGALMRAKAVLATFYVVYQNQYGQALNILESTLILGQRLSRLNPQLYLSEVADMYLWEGSCHKQMKQYTQAIRVYELASRYYEQLALKNPLKLEAVCGTYFLIAESYNQLLNQTNDSAFRTKGINSIQKGLEKVIIWSRYDPTGAEMMRKNLSYYQEVFEGWGN